MRILIVDDEPLARVRLAGLLAELTPSLKLPRLDIREAESSEAAIGLLGQGDIDLLLLDIRMPGIDGIHLATYLQSLSRVPLVIFVTAQLQHALKAFDLDAVDYLTKPVSRDRLRQALEKAVRRHVGETSEAQAVADLVFPEKGRLVRLPVAEVLYLRAGDKYVTVRTASASHLLEDSLMELESRLGPTFLRVHRNAIVARRAINALERRSLDDDESAGWAVRIMATGEWVAVSRRLLTSVKEALKSGSIA